MELLLQEGNKKKTANLNGKQLSSLVSQPIKNRPLRGREVTGGKYRSAKPMKVYPASKVLIYK